jgi:hypothetical protein
MKSKKYLLESEASLTVFEFNSEGLNGIVPKMVEYTETNIPGVFNLGFGDKNLETGEIDDKAVTNNGDSQKVLTTVASSIYAFTSKYPDVWIFATGSTQARTRLYRIGITTNLLEIQDDFEIYGLNEDRWQIFQKGVVYDAFLIKRKSIKL